MADIIYKNNYEYSLILVGSGHCSHPCDDKYTNTCNKMVLKIKMLKYRVQNPLHNITETILITL